MKFKTFFEKKIEEEPSITTTSIGNAASEGGSANFAKKIGKGKLKKRKKYESEENVKSIGRTSKDDGHDHEAFVDEDGNGYTSPGKKNGHKHEIENMKVQEADGHTHTLK